MNQPPAPGSGDKLDLSTVIGALLYIKVLKCEPQESTFGVADVIIADVAILDGPNKGTVYENHWFWGKVIANQLAAFVGKDDPTVCGRLGQGQAKPGKSAPWVLNAATPADEAIGRKYEAYAATIVAAPPVDTESPF